MEYELTDDGNINIYLEGNISKIVFPYPVFDIVEFENVLVVLLAFGPDITILDNVYGIDFKGNIKWKIQKLESPYTGIGKYEKNNQQLYAYNWSGEHLIINPGTGETLEKGWSK